MQAVSRAWRAAGVGAVYLVHGTFAGPDAIGLLSGLARVFPRAADSLALLGKQLVDGLMGEIGNYTPQYAELLNQALHLPGEPDIPVRIFRWSSENHHIGRADGAVRLLDELMAARVATGKRLMLWGHSHAGNVFALLTHLLGADQATRDHFFALARRYYRWPLSGWVDVPVWQRVEQALAAGRNPLADHPLDIVTFGTPLRYGFETRGLSRVLHFVNHRPRAGRRADQAPWPLSIDDVMAGRGGDYVQQLGIAGSNLAPSFFSWRSWWVDLRLAALLEPGYSLANFFDRLSLGPRVHNDGLTLLVDYPDVPGGIGEHLLGHGIYTRRQWLLFHAETVTRELYTPHAEPASATTA